MKEKIKMTFLEDKPGICLNFTGMALEYDHPLQFKLELLFSSSIVEIYIKVPGDDRWRLYAVDTIPDSLVVDMTVALTAVSELLLGFVDSDNLEGDFLNLPTVKAVEQGWDVDIHHDLSLTTDSTESS